MYCTVKEIIRDVLDTDVPDSECVFAVVLTRGDVRAVMLEKVMALAGSEMKRLYAVGSENGGDGDAFVREEREAMDVVLQALDGETMS
ncbi:hypothetical protein [Escherichia coli]|uniref:hypothetical protein n=1 Tax=Escherichia coli TaxID=562 RepID=UPI00085A582A|nr:hypothetical protein [Escherichia coli]